MSPEQTHSQEIARLIPWDHIARSIDTLTSVEGGFSDAQRGIVTLEDGTRVFVKLGVNEHTKNWVSKEIRVYDFLSGCNFTHLPQLLSTNNSNTGLALPPLLPEDGWDWSDSWNADRLDATLTAMDDLANIQARPTETSLLQPVISEEDRGWEKLFEAPERLDFIKAKLKLGNHADTLEELTSYAEREKSFIFNRDVLVHGDIRADNCAWSQKEQKIMIVDWNWLELGDRRIDLGAFLTHVHQSGYDVLKKHADKLDADGLHWIAGFWLNNASKPIWPGGPEKLRDFQFQSAITALHLAKEIV